MDLTLRNAWLPALTGALLMTSFAPLTAQCEHVADEERYATDSDPWDQYGRDVAMTENWVATSAPAAGGNGAVYVYDRGPSVTEYRVDPVTAFPQSFGWSIAIWDDWLAVGDPNWNGARGRVDLYQYDKSLDLWQFVTAFAGLVGGDEFGSAVSMNGGRLAVGAPDALGVGRVNLYELTGGSWQFVTQVGPDSSIPGMEFGAAVSYAFPLLVVGAPNPADVGYFNGFKWDDTGVTWVDERADLHYGVGELFGASVHTDGLQAIVGKPLDSTGGVAAGAAYVLKPLGFYYWSYQDHLVPIGGAGSQAGTDVRIRGDDAWLGGPAHTEDGQITGAVYRFQTFNTKNWMHQADHFGYAPNGTFGMSLDVDDDEIFVGAPYDFGFQDDTGSLYRFTRHGFDLDVTPNNVVLFDPVNATACGGTPGKLLGLFAVEVDGMPVFIPIAFSTFNATGDWSLFGVHANPAYSGLNIDLVSLAIDANDKVVWSNQEGVNLQ